MSILNVNGVQKIYTTRFGGNKVEALKRVTFDVEQGEYVAIMGESGSGKTTLLNILAALDKPTAGSVILDGNDLSKIKESQVAAFRRDNLGFVFQEFNLLDTFTLEDNIYLPLVLSGKNHREMEERLKPIAAKLGITDLLKKYPYEVSGGQKQRAAVARALITNPKLILAWDGIRKNRRMYFPYILTGGVMVMMYYIMSFLTESPALQQMPGGSVLMTVLPMGCGIIAIFSLLFLFYTNSFLIKQRYREFGLYNILGMDKRNVGRLMIWETLFIWILAMVIGLAAGIAFSKAAELILLNLLGMEVSFSLSIGTRALSQTVLIYAGIYVILLFNSVIKVVRSRPLELMQSSRVGEQKLKCNWLFAAAGVILLGAAYFLAVRIEEPTEAFFLFFVAVIMVILGTYLLFISGSVAFCKLLQSNKNYYYKPNHFVSVSSMAYRMKRNGAGLASICILLTMVLVMLSSTTTLYFGEESAVRNRYPQGIEVKIWYDDIKGISDENLDMLRKEIEACTGPDVDLRGIRTCSITGALVEDGIILVDYTDADSASYSNMGYLYAISTDDYNYMMHTDAVLADDECLLYSDRMNTQWDSFTVQFGQTYKVKEQLTEFCADQDALISIASAVYMVVNDLSSLAAPIADMTNPNGYPSAEYFWRCGFDEETPEKEKEVRNQVYEVVKAHAEKADSTANYFRVHSREVQRAAFFEMYGSLFFLGIMLSIVFLLAAVLIIYYKQISEGYEDQNRFEIMQKVGMTKQDIRKSINSQMLTVFFLPLVMAGIHLAFAYPFISKILLLFAFDNTVLNVTVTLTCFAIFGLFYTIVYKITSGSYYAIVSGGRER